MPGSDAKYAVEVKLFANLREAAKEGSLVLEFAKVPTVGDVVDATVERHPALAKLLKPRGRFNDKYKVLVGQNLIAPEDFSRLAGPRVALLPPVSGG